MMKRFIAWVLVIVLLVSFAVPAFAHDKAKHDEIIEYVLFGNKHYKKGLDENSEEYKCLDNLEKAVAICLDQYDERYINELQDLNDCGIHGLPESIDEIKFKGNQHHRRKTHKGWNAVYPEDAHWEERKTILLQTVNDVFSFKLMAGKWTLFGIPKDFGYKEQCDAFAALLYYLHVLGDFDASESRSVIENDVISLTRTNPSDDNPDLFWELERILPIVCKASVKAGDYSGLEVDIKMLEQEARELGGVNDENLQQYRDIVKRLLDHLESKVPGMLQKEPFFSKVFGD